jgi:hypothetical protein
MNIFLLYKYYNFTKKNIIYKKINQTEELSFTTDDNNEIFSIIKKEWINEKINVFVFISSKGCRLCEQNVMELCSLLIEKFPSYIKVIIRSSDNKMSEQYDRLSNYFYSFDKKDAPFFISPFFVVVDNDSNIVLKYKVLPEKLVELNALYKLIEGIIILSQK